ncbi:MAG: tetratricopeptide repeat protein [Bradyrhizobium sp.]|uniref:caspase family protein n=1 Tax=Bradyrhizobium sp. TaxID=376 RepID=UPI0011FAABEA|nr:caspase family protein [Bradyrhizobium sp.]THD63238.1 MAG: tetratricopeptide repeat protein [Bradyrhizobium sp.]
MAIPIGVDAFAADGPGRVALVIGNARYPDNDLVLTDAANDTQDIADELKHDGFDVETGVNLTGDAMQQALDRLYGKISQGSVALIFFDGFGIQSGRQSYLIPVDAQIWTEPDVLRDGFNLETILGEMNNRGALVKIALLNASRRNPFERRFRRYSAGLAPAVTPGNTLVLYSTALGSVANETQNDHSLFVTELLREVRAPGVNAEQALRNTQAGVISASKSEQVPWFSSSLATEFSFNPDSDRKPDVAKGVEKTPACEAAKPASAPGPEDLARDPVIAELSRRLAADPNDQVLHYKRGQIYAMKHAYRLALQDFNAAIRLDPKDVEAYNNRCWTLAAIGDLQPALKDCNEALRLDPGRADALDSRGLVNLKLGKNAESIRDYSEALEKNSLSVSSLFGRGIAKARSGTDGSLDLGKAKSMDPNIAGEFAGYGITECSP